MLPKTTEFPDNVIDEKVEENMKFIRESISQGSEQDLAYGSILGAFVGDSCGSYVEFKHRGKIQDRMDNCMKMLGGGPHQLGKGQITDDSELAMCLLWGLIESNEESLKMYYQGVKTPVSPHNMQPDKIAARYGEWIKSKPFDIGHTTRMGLSMLEKMPLAKVAYAASSIDSQSNGSLMRITPLAVFLSLVTDVETIKTFVAQDTRMTHKNATVINANTLYCIAIGYLMRNKGKAAEALGHVKAASEAMSSEETTSWLQEAAQLVQLCQGDPANSASVLLNNYDTYKLMGWCKHAFILSFFYLELYTMVSADDMKNFYFKSMRETISLGGDTDTNGAIVGGIIGALVGVKGIPLDMLQKVLSFDCYEPTSGRGRPNFLSTKYYAVSHINDLMLVRPQEETLLPPVDDEKQAQAKQPAEPQMIIANEKQKKEKKKGKKCAIF